ncbi:MAG: DEAD/DEAH box helicase family protein, partial [Dehalococcoidia bacterium]
MPVLSADLLAVMRRSRRDPAFFFREVLGWEPWAGQIEIAEAVRDAIAGDGLKRIAVRSGNGVGKTAIAARIMLWALRCHRDSVVITTAPTSRQVTELLWREARDAYHTSRHPLGGRFYEGQPQWELGPRRFALGMSPEHTRPERFQGFHARLILFLADEASGVPEAHWEAIKGSLLAGNAVLLAIGNPTRLHGEFYEAFHRNAHLWRRLHISALDTPNLSGQGVPVPGLVNREGVKQALADWGEDSPLYQVRILGQFPTAASSQLVRLDWVESAVQRYRDRASPAVAGF